VRSLREHWLHLQRVRLRLRRLDARPGRPDRRALIVRAGTAPGAGLGAGGVNEGRREAGGHDGPRLGPAAGLGQHSFRQGEELAWFVFDLFAPQGLEAWRFHADPLETRRPLAERLDPGSVDQVFASPGVTSWLPQTGRP